MPNFVPGKLKFILPLLLCFVLNMINHGQILVGVLNSILLGLSLYFLNNFASKKFTSVKTIYITLLGALPIFNHYPKDTNVIFLTAGIILLFLLYHRFRFKLLLTPFILIYILIAGLYANEVIKYPFTFQPDRLIFNNSLTNGLIANIQKNALYLPHSIRPLVFNNSVYLYMMLSKTVELFMIKNLYDTLLLANLYPLFKGIILDLRFWGKRKLLIYISTLLIPFIIVSSRAVDTFSTYLLISPFLIYFILVGFESINRKIYTLLLILSFILATSPLK